MASATGVVAVRRLWPSDLGDGRHNLSGHAAAADDLVSCHMVGDQPEDRRECAGRPTHPRPGQLSDGLDVAAQVASRLVRPGRERLTGGLVEIDETLLGGLGGGRGRSTAKKTLIAVAAEEAGRGIGRIRMRRHPRGSVGKAYAFVTDTVEFGTQVHTDGWDGDSRLRAHGYRHRVTFLRGHHELDIGAVAPVHRVVSLLKRWLLDTHHSAVNRGPFGLLLWTSSRSDSIVAGRAIGANSFTVSSNRPSWWIPFIPRAGERPQAAASPLPVGAT